MAYDVDGTREACIEMETGRLVPHGDVDGLRSALLWAQENPRDRLALATAGRDLCAREFSHTAMVEHLERVYRDAIGLSGRAAQ